MSVHVFLGPTLPLAAARDILDAEFHPPVQVGDVCELLVDRALPQAIAIIDGYFERVPSVWHKEILYALHLGVPVYGASSMGALRAAELHPFGMIGCGEVFERFRSGELEDDDEVAIVHAPAEDGYRPLSDAMVNLRDGSGAAQTAGVLSGDAAARLVAGAKALYYADRSWLAVYEIAARSGLPADQIAALRAFVRERTPDVKRRDAIALLSRLASDTAVDDVPSSPGFDFEPTYNWEKLVTMVRGRRQADELSRRLGMPLPDVYAAVSRARPDLIRDALLDLLGAREAQRLGLSSPDNSADRGGGILDALRRRYSSALHAALLRVIELEDLTEDVPGWLISESSDPQMNPN